MLFNVSRSPQPILYSNFHINELLVLLHIYTVQLTCTSWLYTVRMYNYSTVQILLFLPAPVIIQLLMSDNHN